MWRSEDEDHSDAWWTTASSSGWWTRYGSSSTEGRWTKSPGRGCKKWTDTVKVGECIYTKEAKAAAVARRGTEKASATVATMAARKQVQEALQRKKEGARSRRAMPSSVAKSTKTNEQKKVRFMVPPEVPNARMSIEDLANFDEPDVDELERDGLHRALRNALETQVLVCADECSASLRTMWVVLETNKRPSSVRQKRVCEQTESLNSSHVRTTLLRT